MDEQIINGTYGDFSNPYHQNYEDTCAIKSQQLIMQDFGIDVTEDQCVQYSMDHGWYSNDGSGTSFEDVGKLLDDSGIPCTKTDGANVYDLANELSQGHKVIVGVDSEELWSNSILDWLRDIFVGDTPDHALIVAGIDMTDPDNPMVMLTDPGTGDCAKPYPLDQFMDAWSDSNCFMVSTDVATPSATECFENNGMIEGHLPMVADVNYDTFTNFLDYSHQIDFNVQGPQLYDMFQNYPTMDFDTFDNALSFYNMQPFDSTYIPSTTPAIDPFLFDYSSVNDTFNTNWLNYIDTGFNDLSF